MLKIRMLSVFIFAILALLSNGQTGRGPTHGKVVVCYLASWSVYRPDEGKFQLQDLDPSLCTHIIYSFAGLDENTNSIRSIDPPLDKDGKILNGGYKAVTNLKTRYPHLKVTLAVGGWNEGSLKFSNMAASKESRTQFIQSVLELLDEYKFDGIDMHWKYPVLRGGKPEDKANFVILIKELKEAFRPRGYILTAAFGPLKETMESSYDIPELNIYLDYVHLLAFDYHGVWDGIVGINAPLNGYNDQDMFCVENSIKYLISQGMSTNKIVLGMALFGRTFNLQNPSVQDITFGSTPAKSEAFAGPYTNEPGFLAYNEICKELTDENSKWVRHWHEPSSTPYLRDGDRVITYDNTRSYAIKVRKAMAYDLAGVMVWFVDMDDFRGTCDMDTEYVSLSSATLHDFIQKYNRIASNPILQTVLNKLNLPDANQLESLSNAAYLANSKEHIWKTESQSANYVMLRTIDDSITLALEERTIVGDIIKNVDDNTKSPTKYSNNSIFTVVCYFCFI